MTPTDSTSVIPDLRPSAAIYCRVSTRAQAEEGSSLDSQEAACRAYAASLGLRPTHTLREDFPGDVLDRPELQHLRDLVRARDIAAVVVYATDRLSRKPVHLAILIEEFERADVAVHFVTEPLDSSPEGQLIAYVKGYANEIEREKIRERTIRGKRSRAASGRIPQGTGSGLFGYCYDPGTGRRAPNHEAAIVSEIFALRSAGETFHAIAKQLNDRGVPAQQGGRWHPLTVRRIVANETYTGKTVFGRTRNISLGGRRRRVAAQPEEMWLEVPDATPAIITPEQFSAAQAVPPRMARPGGDYLLSGHVRCARCSAGMTGSTLQGRFHYYRCQGTTRDDRSQRCQARMVRAAWLEGEVWQALTTALQSPDVVAAQLVEQRESVKPELVQKLAEVDRHLRSCAKYERQLVRLFGLGELDEAVIRQEAAKNRQRKAALERTRQELAGQVQALERHIGASAALAQFCGQVAERLDTLSFADRRLLLIAVSLEVVVGDESVEARVVFPTDYVTIVQTSA